ncbi:MAG: hydrogenase expression/formation protein [Gammaproteobacteria bacterium]|nr:MAG: hydrogenase expression/formation protein [Gammaproteobacteria bacterium]
MKDLGIPVVDASKDSSGHVIPSLNVEPLLHEVRHALERLQQTGEPTTIDLRAIPLAPGEDEQIRETLGTGEVEIRIDALGPTLIQETAYPGVWWLEHRNADDVLTGRYIEIAAVPALVPASSEDMADGLQHLTENLSD